MLENGLSLETISKYLNMSLSNVERYSNMAKKYNELICYSLIFNNNFDKIII